MPSRPLGVRIIAAIGGGLIISGAFPPLKLGLLVWIGMAPLLWALWSGPGGKPGRNGFLIGYLAGLASGLVQCHWVSSVAWLGAIALPAYLALYWGAFGYFAASLGNPWKNPFSPRGILTTAFQNAAVWAGLELARGWIITGFSWNVLGVALVDVPVLCQAADLLGVVGLSLLIVFFQATLVQSLATWNWRPLAAAAGVVALTASYGALRIHIEKGLESIRLKSLLVQLNVPMEASRMLMTDVEMHQAYEEETLAGLAAAATPPDWVMWPEMSLTGRILTTPEGDRAMWQINHDTIEQVRTGGDFQLIYGVGELEAERHGDGLIPKENGKAYNSVAIMGPTGELQIYRKHHLVIFGETIPFVDSIPFLKSIYEQQAGVEFGGSFTPGDSLSPIPVPAGTKIVGAIPTICFEDSVPRLTRRFVRPGPQVIINVTNDGWFKETAAADQHFQYARFRAIELRRPMLRSANTGVSAAISTTGSVLHPDTGRPQILADPSGNHFTRGSLLVETLIPIHPSFSLYALIGDWGLMALAALALLGSRPRKPRIPSPA